jgi:glucosylceramidase
MLAVETLFNRDQGDSIYSCASINEAGLISVQALNTSKQAVQCGLQIGKQYASMTIDANALSTIRIPLHHNKT